MRSPAEPRKMRVARLRREKREARATVRLDQGGQAPGRSLDDGDEYRVLHEEVSRLPEKYRVAIVLCYFEGLTHDQAAETLRWPVGTVRGYLARAREVLRTRLVRRGVAPAVALGLMECRSKAGLPRPLIDSVLRALVDGVAAPTVTALGAEIARGLAVSRLKRLMAALALVVLGAGGAAVPTAG